jgi:hypothetical protein
MMRRLASVLAAAAASIICGAGAAALAANLGTSATGGAGLNAGHYGTVPGSGYHGGSGLRSGGGNGHMNAPSVFGGRYGSGWHQPGWGGTRNPGWGYSFGPNLGGSGH